MSSLINFNQLKFGPLFRKSLTVLGLRLLGMALSYGAILYLSNNYGAETYGRFSLIQTMIQFLTVLFSLGLTTAVIKLTADRNHFQDNTPQNTYLRNALIVVVAASLICSVLLYLLRTWLSVTIFNDPELIPFFEYLSYFLLFAILHGFLLGFIQGKGKFMKFGFLMYVLPYVLFIGFLIAFKKLEFSESSTILGYLLSFSLISLFTLNELPFKRLKSEKSFGVSPLLKLSVPMMLSSTFIFLAMWTDIFMLGFMVSKQELGIYNAAYKLAVIALVVINAVNTVLAPKIAELYGRNDIAGIKTEVQKATRIITYATLPIVALLIVFRKWLLGLFGPEFVEAETALIIIALGMLFNAISGSVSQVLNMTRHQRELRNITLMSGLLNIVLNYFLISEMGIVGAAVASLATNIFINTTSMIYIKRKFNFLTLFRP